MERDVLIAYWRSSAEADFVSSGNLFAAREYHWSLFVGHLAVEKLFKAYWVKVSSEPVPRSHDLERIAERAGLSLTDSLREQLRQITLFNLETRYADFKNDFRRRCTAEFTTASMAVIRGVRQWLISLIDKP